MKSILKKTGLYEPVRASWLWVKRPQWWKRERARQRLCANVVPRGALCFDVGANKGEYTADLLAVGAGRVVAVEPQAACVRRLAGTYGGDPRVTIVAAAVGPAEGSVTLYAPGGDDADSEIASCSAEWRDAVTASGRFAGHDDWARPVEVPMTTLDKLIAIHGRPALCKIDVEGFELDVLRGLSTPIPAMSFEFSPETIGRTDACVAYLAGLGDYRFNYCAHGHYAYGLPEKQPAGAFRQTLRELPPQAMKWGGDVYATLAR